MDQYEAVATNSTISAVGACLRQAAGKETAEDLLIHQAMSFAPMHPNGFMAHVMMDVSNQAAERFQVVSSVRFVREKNGALKPSYVELQIHSEQWQWKRFTCSLDKKGEARPLQ